VNWTPETFERGTVAREGAPGAAWLAELPDIIRDLLERWDCIPDGGVMHGGVGIVVPVLRKPPESAVLKISFPHPGNRHEREALAAWGGRGTVLLHERDDEQPSSIVIRSKADQLPCDQSSGGH
jgi:streptomycin 6-kinase